MRIEFDKKAEAVYVHFSDEPIAYTKKLDAMRYIDYAENYSLIGVELFCVSKGVITDDLPQRQRLKDF